MCLQKRRSLKKTKKVQMTSRKLVHRKRYWTLGLTCRRAWRNVSTTLLLRICSALLCAKCLPLSMIIACIPGAGHLFRYVTNMPPKANSAFHPSGVGKWVPASAGKTKAGMVHSVSGWTRGVQVKLWDPLRTRAIPERLRGVFTTSAIQIHVYLYLYPDAHVSTVCHAGVKNSLSEILEPQTVTWRRKRFTTTTAECSWTFNICLRVSVVYACIFSRSSWVCLSVAV